MDLGIKAQRLPNITVIDLDGKLTIDNIDELFKFVQRQLKNGQVAFVINCKDLTFVDSAGLAVLIACYLTAKKQLKLANIGNVQCSSRKNLRSMMESLEMAEHFPDYASVAEAAAAFQVHT